MSGRKTQNKKGLNDNAMGFLNAFKVHQEDKDGNPIPWIAYSAIDFIQSRIKSDMSVFEFGSGASTAWWAKRVKEVDAVENDEEWFNFVQKNKSENSNIFLETEELYFTKPSCFMHICTIFLASADKSFTIVFISVLSLLSISIILSFFNLSSIL